MRKLNCLSTACTALFVSVVLLAAFPVSNAGAQSTCTVIDSTSFKNCLDSITRPGIISIQNNNDFSVYLDGDTLIGITIDVGVSCDTIIGNPVIDQTFHVLSNGSGKLTIIGSLDTITFYHQGQGSPRIDSLDYFIGQLTGTTTLFDLIFDLYGIKLPIQLIDFHADVEREEVHLFWTTASELNNAYMAVERSGNGLVFTEIGRVEGLGTSDGAKEYTFTDHNPLKGVNYYRLHQVDFDGKSEVYNTITVLCQGAHVLNLSYFPNPAQHQLQLRWNGDTALESELRILDLMGRERARYAFAAGILHGDLPLGDLTPGAYILQIMQGNRIQSVKFVKQ